MAAHEALRCACCALLVGWAACAPATLNEAPLQGESSGKPPIADSVSPTMVELMPPADPVRFRWTKVNAIGGELTEADLKGRVSVLVFITSYDVPSQAQVRFLSTLGRDHVPRLNAVALVLEPPEHLPIVEAFASALDLKYPVVLADPATIRGEGPFAGLHHVPAVAILDRDGRERFRHLGLMPTAQLEDAVRLVEQATGVNKK